ncbi:hypothetical protein MycrhDRAFT_0408 [Mycolicibacterium rhodesiae JS60]|nr:hypothetical protein MycrhDRAFT_0408 [Mycolicibacterium rhodesiae JS60]
MRIALGPLPTSDTRFMHRVRVHQAWYRAFVLGVAEFGNLAISGAPCGSVLPDKAAQRFLNFYGSAAVERYMDRRTKGWGVDPIRCTKYLTSSQTLSFNMLAEAVSHPRESAALLNLLLGRDDLLWLETSDFEFAAQGSTYALGDKTLLDILLRFRTVGGRTQVVAVETKLADRFSTRRTSGMTGDGYRQLALRSDLWSDLHAALADNRSRQLARCHALAESIQTRDDGGVSAVLLVLTHPADRAASCCVDSYKEHVRHTSFIHRSWTDFLESALAAGAVGKSDAGELSRRYVDLAWSETAWRELEEERTDGTARTKHPHKEQY